MATNNFKPFAIGAGANVLSQAEYEALAALVTGFTSGKASSAQVNKALRQSTFIAASIAQFILNKSAIDVLDDGDLAGFVTDFGNALNKHSQPLDAGLTSLAALAGGANMLPYYTAADVFAQTSLTAIGRSLIGQTTQANALSYLGGAPLASPTFTGTPAAPTAAAGTSTTQIATTAFVQAVAALLAPLSSPALTGTPTAPTAAAGTATDQIATMNALLNGMALYGIGGAGATTPTYTIHPADIANTSPTRIIQALNTEDQATVGSPVANQSFGGLSVIRGIRPAQFGVSGQGAEATFWYRGFSGALALQSDWLQLATTLSPTFTGTPTAPTATAGTSTTQIANTAFVGAAIVAATGRLAAIQKFTSSGTYTPTPGVTKIIVEMVGGGGGGGGAQAGSSTSNSVGGGGGSGAYVRAMITSPAASYAITVGSGGSGGTTGQGGTGGATTFGSLISCGGGSGGYTGTSSNAPNAAGGGFGGSATVTSPAVAIFSSNGGFGNAGYMTTSQGGNAGNGATVQLGNGGFGSANGGGSVGGGYGSGGGGALTTTTNTTQQNGGAGAGGVVIIYEYY